MDFLFNHIASSSSKEFALPYRLFILAESVRLSAENKKPYQPVKFPVNMSNFKAEFALGYMQRPS